MVKYQRTRIGAALLLAGSMTGCAGGFPFWGGSSGANLADSDEARLVAVQNSIDAAKAPSGISGAFSSATAAVADAFTIEPRVTKAVDPLALSNQPEEIGPELFLTAGALCEARGDLAGARQQYERALKNQPDQLMALISLARLTDKTGNSVEAEEIYRRALAAHPQSAMAHNDLGLFHARKGQPHKAVAELEQAARLESENVRYGNNYATVLVEIGQYEKAFAQLRTTSAPAEAHYNLGYLLHHNDQNQLARQHFVEAARLNPHLQQAQAMLARLNAGENQQAQASRPDPGPYLGQAPAGTPSHWAPSPSGYSQAGPAYQQPNSANQPANYTASRPPMQHLPPVSHR